MDEYAAWNAFVMTGRVSDYLNYCRVKLGYPPEDAAEQTEDDHEKEYGRPNYDGEGRWR